MESSVCEKELKKKNKILLNLENLIKEISENKEKTHLYYGNLYLIKKDFDKALEEFKQYYDYWNKAAAEEGIDPGQKSSRQTKSAQGLLLSALTNKVKADSFKESEKSEEAEKCYASSTALLEKLVKEYPEDKETQFLAR